MSRWFYYKNIPLDFLHFQITKNVLQELYFLNIWALLMRTKVKLSVQKEVREKNAASNSVVTLQDAALIFGIFRVTLRVFAFYNIYFKVLINTRFC